MNFNEWWELQKGSSQTPTSPSELHAVQSSLAKKALLIARSWQHRSLALLKWALFFPRKRLKTVMMGSWYFMQNNPLCAASDLRCYQMQVVISLVYLAGDKWWLMPGYFAVFWNDNYLWEDWKSRYNRYGEVKSEFMWSGPQTYSAIIVAHMEIDKCISQIHEVMI